MARIRSTHPGQWSDEDFVGLSFPARLLALAIRNIADDHGVFEWKPVTIKMQLFPADAVDTVTLLDELLAHNIVMQFEHAGKKLGAIRNFMKWQRPKKPNFTYPVTPPVLEYVGEKVCESGTSEGPDDASSPPVPNQFPTGTEKSPQRKEVGGRRKRSTVEDLAKAKPPTPAADESADWHGSAEEEFWATAPTLHGKGVSRAMVGKLANILGGDFSNGVRILRDTATATKPAAYLGKIITKLKEEAAAELPPDFDPSLPAWITEARAYGYPVEREGKYWRFAGGLYDDSKELCGN